MIEPREYGFKFGNILEVLLLVHFFNTPFLFDWYLKKIYIE